MAKFVNSEEAISTSLLLWNDKPTQVSIQETYNLKVWPITNILNDGPINFNIPSQPKGMLTDINMVTKLKIQEDGKDLTEAQKSLSIVNNFANALWSLVDVKVDDRTDLTQSMKNAYVYSTFFNHALNSQADREDYLFYNELFKMDEGGTKGIEEGSSRSDGYKRIFWKYDSEQYDPILKEALKLVTGDAEKTQKSEALKNNPITWKTAYENKAASLRSKRIFDGKSVTLNSKLQCPLFNTSKCLPTNMKIRVSLTKNSDEFLLLTNSGSKFNILIEDAYLDVTYYRPRDQILQLIEDRLQKDPAPYFISRPELILKPISNAGKIIRLTDIFHEKIPPFAFFCLQKSSDFEGKFETNPFTFIPFKTFQFYVNGTPYFADPLEVSRIEDNGVCHDFGNYLRQLYRTIGKDLKGNCLINSSNFQLNFMVGISFGADRNSTADKHMNLQEKASTYLEIDMGINEENIPKDMLLITYAVYDRQIQIDGNRRVRIIE